MTVLVNDQAMEYLISTKKPDESTSGFFYSQMEGVWIAFSGSDISEKQTKQQCLQWIMNHGKTRSNRVGKETP